MSYDEIDFANNLGNDDIEIDIDLEPGQNDEDYILEDVNSELGHGEAIVSHDDYMLDDETASFPMDDVDIIQDEHIEMEDADPSDTLDVAPQDSHVGPDLEKNDSTPLAGFVDTSEILITELNPQGDTLTHTDAEQLPEEQELIEDAKSPNQGTLHTDPTVSSPTSIQLEPAGQTSTDQHILPSDLTHSHPSVNVTDPEDEYRSDLDATSTIAAVTEQTQGELGVKSGTGNSTMLAAAKVVVIYRGAEYALCSSSESDDPDTFFLKDSNLVNGSLANLLAGLREVIHEDLGPEDELCLTAEDLGIEINETCISVREVTFANVVNLHERLLRNDGVATPGPLYVTLGTKPDFAKRLAVLATGATDGKGMSDFVSWDEESNELEEEVGENHRLNVSDEQAETSNNFTQNNNSDPTGESAPNAGQPENVDTVQNSGSEAEEAAIPKYQDQEQISRDHDLPASSDSNSHLANNLVQGVMPDNSSATHTTEASDYSKDGLDEDGDLIDYEDEEYDRSRENSASANVDNSDTHKEKVSVPDQQLLPHVPEEDTRQANNEDDEHTGYQETKTYEGDNLFTRERTGEESVHDGEEFHISYDDFQDENEGDDGNVIPHDVTINAQRLLDLPNIGHQSRTIEIEGDIAEEEHNSTDQDSLSARQTNQSTTSGLETENYKKRVTAAYDEGNDEISYEEVDVPNSNESEFTLTADEFASYFNSDDIQQEDNDEINYDSDDEYQSTQHAKQKVTYEASPTVNGHTGKRQRIDAEDATDISSNHSKRARP